MKSHAPLAFALLALSACSASASTTERIFADPPPDAGDAALEEPDASPGAVDAAPPATVYDVLEVQCAGASATVQTVDFGRDAEQATARAHLVAPVDGMAWASLGANVLYWDGGTKVGAYCTSSVDRIRFTLAR